ncbi:MAG: hypothetical protein Kow0099_32320 [Candidatus Abyssubacteria bacterium]
MVLTPDQKRRIAELDVKAQETRDEAASPGLGDKLRAAVSNVSFARLKPLIVKGLLWCLLMAVGVYYVSHYQLHRINFRTVFSSGPGNVVDRLVYAVKLQKEKTEMLQEGHSHFLAGDFSAALDSAKAVAQMDPKDQRAQGLIDLAAEAAYRRAAKEFDSGEIEAALSDVRLALKYRPEHTDAKALSLRIAGRLLREAQVHYSKKEYLQLITKAQEVIRINPSEPGAMNLLMRTNSELLSKASELLVSRKYYDAAENVQLALKIDPTNSTALRLLEQLTLYIETPDIKLRGITRLGKAHYAIIQLPDSNQPQYVKEGETFRNIKIVDVNPENKTVQLLQIYTKQTFTIELSKAD